MKKKKLENYKETLLLVKLYKQMKNEILIKQVNDYLDQQTNDKFNIYMSERSLNGEKNKVKMLTLYR